MEAPSEKVQAKARAYLSSGQVKAHSVMRTEGNVFALFHVTPTDGGDPYDVKYATGNGWSCDCVARVPVCAHVWAASLVLDVGKTLSKPTLGFNRDTGIDDLLRGLS